MTFGSEGLTISSETDGGNSGLYKLAVYLVAVDCTYDRSWATLENALEVRSVRLKPVLVVVTGLQNQADV